MLADLIAIGPGSYINELIEIAGGTNVLAIAGQPEYPRISMETVLRLDPDVIVDTVDMGDTDAERRAASAGQRAAVERLRHADGGQDAPASTRRRPTRSSCRGRASSRPPSGSRRCCAEIGRAMSVRLRIAGCRVAGGRPAGAVGRHASRFAAAKWPS